MEGRAVGRRKRTDEGIKGRNARKARKEVIDGLMEGRWEGGGRIKGRNRWVAGRKVERKDQRKEQ